MANCLECSKEFRKRSIRYAFCGGTCRNTFNNRRQLRGMVLYDLQMIADRPLTGGREDDATLTARRRAAAAIATWAAEDKARGRRSHKPVYEVLADTLKFDVQVT